MPATNYTPIQLYRSSSATVQPIAANLQAGELAINFADGRLFYKDNAGTPAVQIIGTRFGANKTIGETIAAGLSASTGVTGTGALAFATSPTFTTPVLGVATATTINKVTFTQPASGSTLTIANGKTLTASNSITLAGTDSTTMTFPPASSEIGYLNVPQNGQSTAYTTVLADAGKLISHPSTDANARTFTIDNGVAYPLGTVISFSNMTTQNVTIDLSSGTLYWSNISPVGTGSRTLGQYGLATAVKIETNVWFISGSQLT